MISSISKEVKSIGIYLFCLLIFNGLAHSQLLSNSFFVSVPDSSNLQGIACERVGSDIFFYVGFDEGDHGAVKTYKYVPDLRKLQQINCLHLPFILRHPNDIDIKGDSLIICGWNGNSISNIGFIDKYSGSIVGTLKDTLENGWHLQIVFSDGKSIYRGITNSLDFKIEKLVGKQFQNIGLLAPSPYRQASNYVQGSKFINEKCLAILTSFPSRIDFFDYDKNTFRYISSYDLGYDGDETEGLGVIEENRNYGMVDFYYGIRPPNRINIASFELPIISSDTVARSTIAKYELLQNYPNPFNATTIISYRLPEASDVTLKVYDMIGREVTTLVNERQEAGSYVVRFDAMKLASGVYICRLQARNFVQSRKLILLR